MGQVQQLVGGAVAGDVAAVRVVGDPHGRRHCLKDRGYFLHPLARLLLRPLVLGDVGQYGPHNLLSIGQKADALQEGGKKRPVVPFQRHLAAGLALGLEDLSYVGMECLRAGGQIGRKGTADEQAPVGSEKLRCCSIRLGYHALPVERQISDRGKVVKLCVFSLRFLGFDLAFPKLFILHFQFDEASGKLVDELYRVPLQDGSGPVEISSEHCLGLFSKGGEIFVAAFGHKTSLTVFRQRVELFTELRVGAMDNIIANPLF